MNFEYIGRELRRKVLWNYQQAFSYADKAQRNKAQTSVRLALADAVPDDKTRRKVMSFLLRGTLTDLSTRDLTDAELEAFRKWLSVLPAPNDTWTISMQASLEIKALVGFINGELCQSLQPQGESEHGEKQAEAKRKTERSGDYFTFEP